MTELERRSSSDLLSRGEGKQGLRQRRDKEQMVAEHGAVTQSLQVCYQSCDLFHIWQTFLLFTIPLSGNQSTIGGHSGEKQVGSGKVGGEQHHC